MSQTTTPTTVADVSEALHNAARSQTTDAALYHEEVRGAAEEIALLLEGAALAVRAALVGLGKVGEADGLPTANAHLVADAVVRVITPAMLDSTIARMRADARQADLYATRVRVLSNIARDIDVTLA